MTELDPPYPRWYALSGQQGELVLALWLPVFASDERWPSPFKLIQSS